MLNFKKGEKDVVTFAKKRPDLDSLAWEMHVRHFRWYSPSLWDRLFHNKRSRLAHFDEQYYGYIIWRDKEGNRLPYEYCTTLEKLLKDYKFKQKLFGDDLL